MLGINEREAHILQNLQQNDKVCIRVNTEHGPYWDELTVKRITKAKIITTDNQHFWKKDGSAYGGMALFKRIYPITEERAKTIEKTKFQHEKARQKRKLIFRIKRCNLNHLSLDQLRQIDVIIGDVEECNKAEVKPAGSS
jgi:hypothetical protein